MSATRRPRTAVRTVGIAFLVSALGSAGLVAVYALGGQPQLEGLLIGVAMGGLAVGFIVWGRHVLPQGPFVEERERMEPSAAERATFERDVGRAGEPIARRAFIRRSLAAALGAFGIAAIFPIRSLGPKPGRTLFHTAWRPGSLVVDEQGVPVAVDRLAVGGVVTVFPQGHLDAADSQAVIVRLDEADVRPVAGREDWSPGGHLAYSKICTHAGCPVGLFEQSTNRLFCPCHQSVFEAAAGAEPSAGPATRPLPQLPLEVDDTGFLRAKGDFSGPVGPGFWNDGA